MAILPDDIYGEPDEATPQATDCAKTAQPEKVSRKEAEQAAIAEQLAPEPVLLPRPRYLVPGQFGLQSVKGVYIKNLRRKNEKALLKACSTSANLTTACAKAGLSLSHVSRVLATNPALRQRVREHLELAIDGLEHAALRRARWGYKRTRQVPTPEGLVEVEEQMPPSDRLAVKILEARRPEVYGRGGREAGATHITNIALMSRDQLEARARPALEAKAKDPDKTKG